MSSYNRYPDEKGTERATNSRVMVPRVPVTTVTPMKRGLKDHTSTSQHKNSVCYNRCPDEKGTESAESCRIH